MVGQFLGQLPVSVRVGESEKVRIYAASEGVRGLIMRLKISSSFRACRFESGPGHHFKR